MTKEETMWKELTAKFVRVRDALNHPETQNAYRMAYKKPWRFYRERTAAKAIESLIEEYER